VSQLPVLPPARHPFTNHSTPTVYRSSDVLLARLDSVDVSRSSLRNCNDSAVTRYTPAVKFWLETPVGLLPHRGEKVDFRVGHTESPPYTMAFQYVPYYHSYPLVSLTRPHFVSSSTWLFNVYTYSPYPHLLTPSSTS